MYSETKLRALLLTALLVLGGLAVLPGPASAAEWNKTDMGKPYGGGATRGLSGVYVGDGNRDGVTEVYFSCTDNGRVYVFTYNSTNDNWTSSSIGILSNANEVRAQNVIVGDGDDDGKLEVYSGGVYRDWPWQGWTNRLWQFLWNGTAWVRTDIGATGSQSNDIDCGEANNDDRNEIVSGDQDSHVYMYAKGNDWNTQDMGNVPRFWYGNQWNNPNVRGVAIGDGDNNGYNEVYAATSNHHVYRFNYTSSAWNITDVGIGDSDGTNNHYYQGMTRLVVGDADNDGSNEVYSTSYINASIYRFRWNSTSGSWEKTNLLSLGASLNALDLAYGDGNGDGKYELYAGASNKQVYEVSYDSSAGTWSSSAVGSGDAAMTGVGVGAARGDSAMQEVFAACADGHGYEFYFDSVPPNNPTVSSDTHPVPGNWYSKNVAHLTWKDVGTDFSGIDGYSVAWDTDASTVPAATKTYEETVHEATSSVLADGSYYFHIRTRDNSRNWNASATHFGPINVDTTPPDYVKVVINDDAQYTNNKLVTLTVTATDPSPGSGIAKMSFSNDGTTWSDWEAFSAKREGWDITDARFGGNNSDGGKEVRARVMDGVGLEIASEKRARDTIMLDRVAPTDLGITINDGAEYATSGDVTLALKGEDPEPASGMWQMIFSNDGVTYSDWTDWKESFSWSLVTGAGGMDADGNRTVFLKVRDRANNLAGPASDTILLDRRAPENLTITLAGGADYVNTGSVDVAIAANDPIPGSDLSEMTVANDAASLGTWEGFSATKAGWSLISGTGGSDTDGDKTVYLKVRDRAGNTAGPVKDSVFLDRVRPGPLSIAIDDDATYTTKADVTLALKAADAAPASGVGQMQLREDGAAWTDWEAYSTVRAYKLTGPDGTKTVHFRVRDRAGNVADSVSDTIILDTASPVITNVRVVGITDVSAIITWTTDEEADSGVDFGLSTNYGSSKLDSGFVTSHSIALGSLTASTTYHFQAYSKDRAGNAPAYSSDFVFITAPTPDTTPPQISAVEVSGITDTLAVVSWTTNEPADSLVDYGQDTGYGQVADEKVFVLKHSITLLKLQPETVYHLRVSSTDPSGNGPARSADQSFTTLRTPDTVPPVISNLKVTGITDILAVVTWETNEPADGVVEYGLTAAYGKTISHAGLLTVHELTITGLSADTTYHIRVKSTDGTGNGPSVSEDLTFTTVTAPDITAPAVQNLRAVGVTQSTATILWETDEIADGIVDYGTTPAFGSTTTVSEFTNTHSVLLQGLKEGTTYHLRVRSSDPSGNQGTSEIISFKTQTGGGGADTTPPVISGFTVTGETDTRAVVLWSTDEDADSTVEYGNTTAYGWRASDPSFSRFHSIVLVNLLPDTLYHVRVKSSDLFGNGPTVSGDIEIRTKTGPDTVPPRISSVTVVAVTNNSVTIGWATDEPSSSIVEYGLSASYGKNLTSQTNVYNHTMIITGLSPETTYHFRVVSVDPSANRALPSSDLNFTTLKVYVPPGPGPNPNRPATKSAFPWIWLALAVVAFLAVAGGLAYWSRSRRRLPPEPPAGAGRAPAGAAIEVEAVETVDMGAAAPETVEMVAMEEAAAPAPSYAGRGARTMAAAAAAPAASGAVDWGAPSALAPPPKTPIKHIRCPACKTRIPIYEDIPQEIGCPVCGKKGPYRPKGGTPAMETAGGLTPAPATSPPEFAPAPEPSQYSALDALVWRNTPMAPPAAPSPPPMQYTPSPTVNAPGSPSAAQPARRMRCSGCGAAVPIPGTTYPVRVTCPNCGRSGTYRGPAGGGR